MIDLYLDQTKPLHPGDSLSGKVTFQNGWTDVPFIYITLTGKCTVRGYRPVRRKARGKRRDRNKCSHLKHNCTSSNYTCSNNQSSFKFASEFPFGNSTSDDAYLNENGDCASNDLEEYSEVTEFLRKRVTYSSERTPMSSENNKATNSAHGVEFRIPIPKYSGLDDGYLLPEWRMKLPSSVDYSSKGGAIRYKITVSVPTSRWFSKTLSCPVDIASNADPSNSKCISDFTIEKVGIYEYDTQSWLQWALSLLGLLQPVNTVPVEVELRRRSSMLPVNYQQLAEHVSLRLFNRMSYFQDYNAYVITGVEVIVEHTIVSMPKNNRCQKTTKKTILSRTVDEVLEKFSDSGYDATHLLQGAVLEPTYRTARAPSLVVSAELKISLWIKPTVGNPIKATKLEVSSPVEFYVPTEAPNYTHQPIPELEPIIIL